MTFSLTKEGAVMSSQMTHTQSSNIYPLSPSYFTRLHIRLRFQKLRHFYSFSKPHHVTASHPFPGDNHKSTGGRSERTQGQAKMAA